MPKTISGSKLVYIKKKLFSSGKDNNTRCAHVHEEYSETTNSKKRYVIEKHGGISSVCVSTSHAAENNIQLLVIGSTGSRLTRPKL